MMETKAMIKFPYDPTLTYYTLPVVISEDSKEIIYKRHLIESDELVDKCPINFEVCKNEPFYATFTPVEFKRGLFWWENEDTRYCMFPSEVQRILKLNMVGLKTNPLSGWWAIIKERKKYSLRYLGE